MVETQRLVKTLNYCWIIEHMIILTSSEHFLDINIVSD